MKNRHQEVAGMLNLDPERAKFFLEYVEAFGKLKYLEGSLEAAEKLEMKTARSIVASMTERGFPVEKKSFLSWLF